jgi:hypothetical protein
MANIVIILMLPILALIFLSMLLLIRRAEIAIDRLRQGLSRGGGSARPAHGARPTR